ncbi:hypothetical protein CSOJ01_10688 [Colletotrichum sojae]|uniref:Uncharacterized protein n=1 Tax=Colletotrichum sojae TaxID=2175907 RepID=A0A8H6IZI3_9PEZI|nr:hypothetical protein CSOJ01_10688 [Colletotrichum sojae]
MDPSRDPMAIHWQKLELRDAVRRAEFVGARLSSPPRPRQSLRQRRVVRLLPTDPRRLQRTRTHGDHHLGLFPRYMAAKADHSSNDLTATAVEATVKVRGRVASMYLTEYDGMQMFKLKLADDLGPRAEVCDLYGDDPLYPRDHKDLVLDDGRRSPRLLMLRRVRTVLGEGGEGEIPLFRRVGSARYLKHYLEDDMFARFEVQVIILE